MLTATELAALGPTPRSTTTLVRRPLVPIALAAIAGIAIDARYPIGEGSWLAVLAATWIWWLVRFQRLGRATASGLPAAAGPPQTWIDARRLWFCARRLPARASLYLGVLALFAAWHDRSTRVFPIDDIGNWAGSRPRLGRVRGIVASDPIVESTDRPDAVLWAFATDKTRFILRVEAMATDNGWQEARGGLAINLDGKRSDVHVGERVELIGWLNAPPGPANPGEFDYRRHLLTQRIRATLSCEHADALVRLDGPQWSLWRTCDAIRATGSAAFRKHLDADRAALADALVLGKRSALDRDELLPFLESGALHLLVVSGLHLVILTALFWNAISIVNWPVRWRALVVLTAVLGYTLLTGADAPIVRSAVVVGSYLVGLALCRSIEPLNSLAAAVLVVLAADPTDLFRGGPQLSFIAVLALRCLGSPWLDNPRPSDRDASALRRACGWLVRKLWEGTLVSLVIWLVSAPLLLYRFHLFAPVSIVASAPLVLLVDFILALAPAYLAISWLPGAVVAPVGWLLDGLLQVLLWGVACADRVPFGFVYVPAPPGWWVLGSYAVLLLPWCLAGSRPPGRGYLIGNVAWTAVGAIAIAWPATAAPFSLMQLAVGHGNCTVLRTPEGGVVLYDCGSIAGPMVAERTIAPYLWANGIGAIDAVFLSHADLDHYNGLARLARRFPIGKVYVTPQFADADAAPVRFVTDALMQSRVPFALTWANDRFTIGSATLEVLEPSAGGRSESDNASSMVLRCTAGKYTFLLTGDISGSGLDRLLRHPPVAVDVLAAPHHGSRASNPPNLAEWCRPRVVLSSQARPRTSADPLASYTAGGAVVLRTDRNGAIICRATARGLEIDAHHGGKFLLPP